MPAIFCLQSLKHAYFHICTYVYPVPTIFHIMSNSLSRIKPTFFKFSLGMVVIRPQQNSRQVLLLSCQKGFQNKINVSRHSISKQTVEKKKNGMLYIPLECMYWKRLLLLDWRWNKAAATIKGRNNSIYEKFWYISNFLLSTVKCFCFLILMKHSSISCIHVFVLLLLYFFFFCRKICKYNFYLSTDIQNKFRVLTCVIM